jgi:mRNA-degrading endonuclease RelE of RelBE toxin-antitoxin system
MEVAEGSEITAGIVDTKSVIEAVLTAEQLELVKAGATIEIKVETKTVDKSSIPMLDAKVIDEGIDAYKKDVPKLAMGGYIDISMYLKIGDENWNQVTATNKPIDIVIAIPEEYKGLSDNYYIMRAHDGEYTLLYDNDDNPNTITISTGKFSTYALMYDKEPVVVADTNNEKTDYYRYWPYVVIVILVIALMLNVSYSYNLKKKMPKVRHQFN